MGTTLQERIKNIEEYNPDIMFKDGNFILKIRYKDNWTTITPDDQNTIAFAEDNNRKNLYWYVCTIDNVDELFDLIDETINVNKDIERKSELYNEKVKELQELFLSDLSFDVLKSIEFTFPKKKNKQQQKKKDNEPLNALEAVKTANNEMYDKMNYSTKPCDGMLIGSETHETKQSEIDLAIEKAMEDVK